MDRLTEQVNMREIPMRKRILEGGATKMVQIAQFNQLDGSEVLRMIRISSLVSQAVAPQNYDLDLLELTKVAIYKLPSMSTSYCHNYPFGTEVGCHGASTWSKKWQ